MKKVANSRRFPDLKRARCEGCSNEVVIFRAEGGEKYGMVVESSKERVQVKWFGSSGNYIRECCSIRKGRGEMFSTFFFFFFFAYRDTPRPQYSYSWESI